MSSIKLKHSGGNSVSLNPPTSAPTSSEVAFKLPNEDASGVLKSDGSGNLAVESNHFFEVKLSNTQAGYNGQTLTTLVEFDSENYDVGNNFNTSTHLFTVPETGLYQFIGSTYSTENNSTQAWLVVNGARSQYTDWVQDSASNLMCSTHLKYLTAGDTVGYHLHTNDTSSSIYTNQWHTWFKGHKVH